MGLFSGIKKIFKKVTKGIKKVFKPVTKFVGKLMQKKWFKILMIAGAVATVGVALYAGATAGMSAYSTTGSLMDAFVTGSREFMTALLSPIKTAKSAFAGDLSVASRATQATQAAQAANAVGDAAALQGTAAGAAPGPGVTLAGTETGVVAAGPEAAAGAGAAANPALMGPPAPAGAAVAPETGAGGALSPSAAAPSASMSASAPSATTSMYSQVPQRGGILGQAAHSFGKFAGTAGGGMLLAGALQGYGAGQVAEEQLKEKRRIEGLWNDPEEVQAVLDASSRPIPVTPGQNQALVMAPWQIRNQYGYPQTVPFRS